MRSSRDGDGDYSWKLDPKKEEKEMIKWRYQEKKEYDKITSQNELKIKLFCLHYTKQFYNIIIVLNNRF